MRNFRMTAVLLATIVVTASCENSTGPDGGLTNSVLQGRLLKQVDRFGLPAIATVFIPSDMKDAYNEGVPANDEVEFTDEVAATLMAFGYTAEAAAGLADVLLPDVLPINVSQPTAFLNGRAPSDDVITGELMIIFGSNAALNDDHVDANDRSFLTTFPYLAGPHLP